MRHQFNKYPIDLILLILWSMILLPISLLRTDEVLRIIFGLPFLFFIPGYMFIFILYPMAEKDNGINGVERIGLSFGFSIAIVSLIGLLLNYTPWGIRLESVLLSLFVITECFGSIAIYRWKTTYQENRFTISIGSSQQKSNNKVEIFLTGIVILSILIAGSSIIYLIITPKGGEAFTDFYLLPLDRNVSNYPQDILAGANTSVILGLVNHEYSRITYTIEVWLINESIVFNQSAQKNDTFYNNAWFMDAIVVSLNHTEITNEKNQTKKWEYNYTFNINKIGHFKLAFLLFTTPSEYYDPEKDYKDSINLKINNAYRKLHLWLYVG